MPRLALSQDQVAEFSARAVAAAERLFAVHGSDGVTMRTLAAKLGCSPMTPYRYFASREALVAAMRASAFRRFANSQRDAAEHARAPRARIERLRRAYVEFALREPDAYRMMFELRAPTIRCDELVVESRRSFSYMVAAIEDAVRTGVLAGDPLTLAHLVWAEVHGIVSLHVAGKLIFGRSVHDLADVPCSLPFADRPDRRGRSAPRKRMSQRRPGHSRKAAKTT